MIALVFFSTVFFVACLGCALAFTGDLLLIVAFSGDLLLEGALTGVLDFSFTGATGETLAAALASFSAVFCSALASRFLIGATGC